MTANEVKLSLFQLLEEENDTKLLETIREVVLSIMDLRKKQEVNGKEEIDKIVIHTTDGQPLTKKQLEERVLKSVQRVKSGQYISQEALNKEVENW